MSDEELETDDPCWDMADDMYGLFPADDDGNVAWKPDDATHAALFVVFMLLMSDKL